MSERFPTVAYADPAEYMSAYAGMVSLGWYSVDRAAVRRASDTLVLAYASGRQVFVCGNGGSAAIADHLECDHLKCVAEGTGLSPRVRSLASNVALLTAVANDFDYEDVFAFPLAKLCRIGDVLVAISASGNSPNIVKAIACANERGLTSIALTGFDGGRARELAEISLHVPIENYGVVEDVHQGLMHVLAQYIRQSCVAPERIEGMRF